MSSSYENLRSRKQSDNDEVAVKFRDDHSTSESIELTRFDKLSPEDDPESKGLSEKETYSGEEDNDRKTEDKRSLISSSEEIDSDGVVREYEVALKHLGFGPFHVLLLLINGIALSSDAIEVLSISFVLTVFRCPDEFGVGDLDEAILGCIIFLGMLFGSYLWGGMADIIGRRTTIVCSLTVSSLFGLLSAFSPWFWLFVALRFISGFGVGGSLPVIFPYTSEFIRNKYRGPYLGVQSTFWMIGRLLCGALAWIVIPQKSIDFSLGGLEFHSWRLFIALSALPSLIGAFFYFLLPESPRYLLEVGKRKKAIRGLKIVYRLNHWWEGKKNYPVKDILLEGMKGGFFSGNGRHRLKSFIDRCKEIFFRSIELFKWEYRRRTPLLLVIMFCLSFGGYGISLWYPSYVNQINTDRDEENFKKFCNRNVTLTPSDSITAYCDCSNTVFFNFTLQDTTLDNCRIKDVTFSNVTFVNVSFINFAFDVVAFNHCHFTDSDFTHTCFNATNFDNVSFSSVGFYSSSLCNLTGSFVKIENNSLNSGDITYEVFNTLFESVLDLDGDCDVDRCYKEACEDNSRVYRDSFFVSASAFPGNIASAFAVYFLQRNYWLAFSLLISTVTVFLLYLKNSEAFVVVMLCIFTAVSTPAWNDSSLIIAELYPTHLRSTAAGIHLLMARIGAIIGIIIFGLFIRVNPSVPILMVASVLFIGGMTAIGLPKTTRKTLLK